MKRKLLSVLTGRDDESVRRHRETLDRNTEAFERMMAALDRFNTQQARSTNDFVAELDAWSAASRIRRRELVEKATAWASGGSRIKG